MARLHKTDVVSIDDLTLPEIERVFTLADEFAEALERGAPLAVADGLIMATLFYEPSTRTRLSFESAMHRLGGAVISSADMRASSAVKGESLADTVRIVSAYADLSFVMADRRAVRTILDNLLANALRYTPPEGEILLAAEEMKNFVQFTVRDTGRGIEAERLSTIFDRFNPFSESGTGMGLALVRRLVESLGGQIVVESRLGHGATFSFTLPVATTVATKHPIEIG